MINKIKIWILMTDLTFQTFMNYYIFNIKADFQQSYFINLIYNNDVDIAKSLQILNKSTTKS